MAFYLILIDKANPIPMPSISTWPKSISTSCKYKLTHGSGYFLEEYLYENDNTNYSARINSSTIGIHQGTRNSKSKTYDASTTRTTIDQLSNGSFTNLHYNICTGTIRLCKSFEKSTPIYFVFYGNALLISNHMSLLRSRLPRTPPNDEMILNALSINPINTRQTFYEGIYKVMAGECIEITKQGNISHETFSIDSHYEINKIKDVAYLKTILTENISSEIAAYDKIGSHLSGGFDSSIVSAITALLLRPNSKPLFTFSSLPSKFFTEPTLSNYHNDEYKFISDMIIENKNIKPTFIHDDSCTLDPRTYTRFCFDYSDGPELHPTNIPWRHEIFRNANTINVGLLLNAQFGNCSISRSSRSLIKTIKSYRNKLFYERNNYGYYDLFLKKTDVLKNSWVFKPSPSGLQRQIENSLCWRSFHNGLDTSLPLVYNMRYYDPTGSFDLIKATINLDDSLCKHRISRREIGRVLGQGLIPNSICNCRTKGAQYSRWSYDFIASISHFNDVISRAYDDPFLADTLNLDTLKHYLHPRIIKRHRHKYDYYYSIYRMNLMRILHVCEWYLLAKYP